MSEKIDIKYLEYVYDLHAQIEEYLKAKDKTVDSEKVASIFSATAMPYYYWLKDNKKPEAIPTNLLDALKKKFNLVPTKVGLKPASYLGTDDFKTLARGMEQAGFVYDNGEFIRKGAQQ